MKISLLLYAVMVYAYMGAPPVARSEWIECKNAAQMRETIAAFTAPHVGKVDAKLTIYADGRKFAGFDEVKREPVELRKVYAAA